MKFIAQGKERALWITPLLPRAGSWLMTQPVIYGCHAVWGEGGRGDAGPTWQELQSCAARTVRCAPSQADSWGSLQVGPPAADSLRT